MDQEESGKHWFARPGVIGMARREGKALNTGDLARREWRSQPGYKAPAKTLGRARSRMGPWYR
jgi:hypothetical protein